MHTPVSTEQHADVAQKRQRHPLVYVGIGMLALTLGWTAVSGVSHWWQEQQDRWNYGYPRTFQMDADVRHGGVSHFTVENLHGHILITEVQVAHPKNAELYVGPTVTGTDADLQPATFVVRDVNGDGYPDLILSIGGSHYVLLNDHHCFRPDSL